MTKTRSNSNSSENDVSQASTLSAILNEIKSVNNKLGELTIDLSSTKNSVDAIEARQVVMEQALKDVQSGIQGLSDLDDRVTIVEQSLKYLDKNCKSRYETMRMRVDNVEVMLRRNNIVIRGLDDVVTEDRNSLAAKVQDMFLQKLNVNVTVTPAQVFRKGPFIQCKIRSIVFKADSYDVKISILSKNTMLKGTSIYIEHDFTAIQLYARFMLRKFAKTKLPDKYKWVGTTSITIANEKYRFDFSTDAVVNA